MANGTIIDTRSPGGGGLQQVWLMLDAQVATSDGVWVDLGWAKGKKTFEVAQAAGTGTVTIQGTNGSSAGAKPADTADGTVLATVTTFPSTVTIEDNLTYWKVEKTASDSTNGTTVVCVASSEM